ncbi:MAG: hypothetical protein ABJA98_22505 [Acidobacteriota bacterium]
MFMNLMDDTDHGTLVFFTKGAVTRMHDALKDPRRRHALVPAADVTRTH